MGERLVLQNNGTGVECGWSAGATVRTNHFCCLSSMAGPKGFQTRTLRRLGGTEDALCETLDRALQMGAQFVELPGGFARFDRDRLQEYDRRLEDMPLDAKGVEHLKPGKPPIH